MNKNEKKIIITIDGYSSIGKTSLARALAIKLGYKYIDSGAMYRAITLLAIRKNFNIEKLLYNNIKISELLSNIDIKFQTNSYNGYKDILLNGENIEKYIRKMDISDKVSLIATIPKVRKKLLHLQQEMGKNKGIVMDGRDIGSTVFPNASLKIFLNASLRIRAYRRYKELLKYEKKNVTYNNVYNNIIKRDFFDKNRLLSPIIKPYGAIEIDNTFLSFEKQLNKVYILAIKKINKL